ncbi:hypothetical protein HU200_021046 [Digitaria exilis]|uniref:Inosine/uridine-preferring nucleoside hydrolase domain-containing protein n=1 Tax=Digitaria exilis TaxID=1010633 RepID=A0A835EZP9_9POAL|nr:hypothetical protein HU200_021046 [Digitaria exilis]
MAILVALRSPELEVIGLTTTFGNVHTPVATRNALHLVRYGVYWSLHLLPIRPCPPATVSVRLSVANAFRQLEAVGRTDIPVAEGSHVTLKVTSISSSILHTHFLSLLLTVTTVNGCSALELDPSFPKKIGQIIVLGGAYSVNGNVNPAAESNIFGDPDAADIIFTCGADVLAVGINITQQVILSEADREKLEHSDSKYSRYICKSLAHYFHYHREVYFRKGVYLHDPTALLAAVNPSLMTYAEGVVRVQTAGITKGLTLFKSTQKWYLEMTAWSVMPTVKVAVTVDAPAVVEMMMQRLMADD